MLIRNFVIIIYSIIILGACFIRSEAYYFFSIMSVITCYLIFVNRNLALLYSWLLINGHLILPAIMQMILGDPNHGLLHIEFTKTLLAGSMYYFFTIIIIRFSNIDKAITFINYSVVFWLVGSFIALIFLSDYKLGETLYAKRIIIFDTFYWSWGRVAGFTGLLIYLFFLQIEKNKIMHKNRISISFSLILQTWFVVLIKSRSLFAYLIFQLINSVRKNFETKKGMLISFFVLCSLVIFTFNSGILERFYNTFPFSEVRKESRVQLWIDFYDNVDFSKIFGTLDSPSAITSEGLESFHSLLLDSFWYSGYLGIISALLSLHMWIKRIFQVSTQSSKIAILFLLIGLLMGAPPFADIVAINILAPFLLLDNSLVLTENKSHQKVFAYNQNGVR